MRRYPVAIALLAGCLAGCGGPKAYYRQATPDDLKSLETGQLLFQLRSTNITISGKTDPKNATSPTDAIEACQGTASAHDCLSKITVVPTPTAAAPPTSNEKGPLPPGKALPYIALDGNIVFWRSTKFSGVPLGEDPTLLKTVNVIYGDSSVSIITAAGTAAATASAFGPWAALGAGVVAGVATAAGTRQNALDEGGAPLNPPAWQKVLCGNDQEHIGDFADPPQIVALNGPIVVSLEETQRDVKNQCWHMLPASALSGHSSLKAEWSGWLYRVKLGDPVEYQGGVPPTLRENYFAAAPSPAMPLQQHTDFPVAACRPAEFDIIWWADVEEQKLVHTDIPGYRPFSFQVSDANEIDSVPLPKNGTITMLSICGGYGTYNAYSGATVSSELDELVKQIGAVKKAQDDYYSAKKKQSQAGGSGS
jgi:hypothetical protein